MVSVVPEAILPDLTIYLHHLYPLSFKSPCNPLEEDSCYAESEVDKGYDCTVKKMAYSSLFDW